MPEDRPADEEEVENAEGAGEAAPEEKTTSLEEALEPVPEGEAALAYHQRARLAEDRLAEVLAAYRTLKKETEAHRDRLTRNLERRYDQRRERLLLKFIDILDNLDRALQAAQSSWAGQPLLEGMILVRTQLLQTLKAEGLERIPVLGLPFDPMVSESVGTESVKEPEQDHLVVKELMRGYRLQGRIARVSRVVIGVYQTEAVEPPLPPGEELIGIPIDEPAAPIDEPLSLVEEPVSLVEVPASPAGGSDHEGAEPAKNLDDELTELTELTPLEEADAPQEADVEPAVTPSVIDELSLEEIIRRAEAQEALFPGVLEPTDPAKPNKE